MKILISILVSSLFFLSCSNNKVQLVSYQDQYSLEIPSFLVEVNSGKEQGASLQYYHAMKELYVKTINHTIEEGAYTLQRLGLDTEENSVATHAHFLFEERKNGYSEIEEMKTVDTLINGMAAKIATFRGDVNGVDLFYTMGVYEGARHFYQVHAWTAGKQQRFHEEKMMKMLYSLKELDGGK